MKIIDVLEKMCVESDDLKECLDINLEKVEWLEKEFKE